MNTRHQYKGLTPFEVRRAARLPRLQRGLRMGFSTLEMLIAMSILILALSAVVVTGGGIQSVVTDSQVSAEALGRAQQSLDYMQALSRKDFKLVTPTTTVQTVGGLIYTKTITVATTSLPDYATKKIISTVSWIGEHERAEHVSLAATVANFDNAVGGDTCDSTLSGDWKTPITENAGNVDFRQLIATSTGINIITNLDAHKGKLYVSVGNTTYKTDPNFFIFNIAKLKSDPTHSLLGKLDTATTSTTGLASLAIAEGTTTGTMFAYVANKNNVFCTPALNCAQLQIINVSNSTNLTLASTTNYKLTNVTGSGTQANGNSIFYKNGFVYLGLTKTATGPEFNIIDVHNPLSPQRVGSYSVGANVNAITVVGGLAYLATNDNSNELIVLNISNPVNPVLASSYNAPGQVSAGYGLSLDTVGDSLYLGRTYVSNGPEFLILDASSAASTMPSTYKGASDLGTPLSTFSVDAVMVRDYLAFIVGESPALGLGKMYVKKVSDPTNISDWAAPIILPSGSLGSGIDCEGNDLFVSSNDSSFFGYLSVITSTP